ncbi:substrate-binding domain-containing protein [Streptomyces hygroscopicus subsp. hygroscopicus]|uniref:DNA-binding LacI/PurR family transcriptional regulator n=1 Tax=Streptomyces demainii TaxID=588122 RepID=A0ABT9L5U3_9ACTN|nr:MULTISPECIES: substrate-binding domain-containing protein [Streptomyces]MBW8091978.1 substrate-binding domain-containing protein [Streptomyces hygroscopicus subsp. hygroscopicus]MCO8305055.1 substrate-binding domain-containing protein [Streptomyces sp. RKCA744]MDP9616075.1 DNA-binding LacI/PurR family transcriptional regulator [Streptomyces demainii]
MTPAHRDRAEPGALGLVLARSTRLLGAEPFFMEFITGMEESLVARDMSVLLHVVPTYEEEIAAYRRWTEGGLVDAVVVVNLTEGDRRPAVLRELGLPAVLVGTWRDDPGLPTVRTDDRGPVRDAMARLAELGHRVIARVAGPRSLLHTQARTAAQQEECREAGIEAVVVDGDYTAESGARLTAELLKRNPRPTAILYDNDVMAVAGLATAKDLGLEVPADLSLIAWDDSTLCRLASPPLTTMTVDVHRYGVLVAEAALDHIDGRPAAERWSPTAHFVQRGTTGPAPA